MGWQRWRWSIQAAAGHAALDFDYCTTPLNTSALAPYLVHRSSKFKSATGRRMNQPETSVYMASLRAGMKLTFERRVPRFMAVSRFDPHRARSHIRSLPEACLHSHIIINIARGCFLPLRYFRRFESLCLLAPNSDLMWFFFLLFICSCPKGT